MLDYSGGIIHRKPFYTCGILTFRGSTWTVFDKLDEAFIPPSRGDLGLTKACQRLPTSNPKRLRAHAYKMAFYESSLKSCEAVNVETSMTRGEALATPHKHVVRFVKDKLRTG